MDTFSLLIGVGIGFVIGVALSVWVIRISIQDEKPTDWDGRTP
jgi:high-affinity Fe2+/Pb2+ permease